LRLFKKFHIRPDKSAPSCMDTFVFVRHNPESGCGLDWGRCQRIG
jgi:hypothetical protein